MSEKSFDEFVSDVLIPRLKNDFIHSDDVLDAMVKKSAELEEMLSAEQKSKFNELFKLNYRYCELLKQECFSDGLIKGLTADNDAIQQDFIDCLN